MELAVLICFGFASSSAKWISGRRHDRRIVVEIGRCRLFLFVASQIRRECNRLGNDELMAIDRLDTYPNIRKLPSHGRSPSRSCPHHVLAFS